MSIAMIADGKVGGYGPSFSGAPSKEYSSDLDRNYLIFLMT